LGAASKLEVSASVSLGSAHNCAYGSLVSGTRFYMMEVKGYSYFFCLSRQQRRTDCKLPYLPISDVETLVERHYGTVQLSDESQDRIRQQLRQDLDREQLAAQPEMTRAQKRLAELEQERRRLASGVVTGSIPEDLAREEQERIQKELTQAQRVLATVTVSYGQIENTLNRALTLVGRAQEAYRLGGPQVRLLLNQSLFEQLYISVDEDKGQVATATLREPWATMLEAGAAPAGPAQTKKTLGRGRSGGCLKENYLVPSGRFELPTTRLGGGCSIP
jgi:site-specific DNA recombinase